MNDIVKALNGTAFAESQIVAEKFNKPHKTVFATIERLILTLIDCDFDPTKYFTPTIFKNDRNRDYRNFTMTSEGYLLLIISMDGEECMKLKVKYIKNIKTGDL